MIAFVAKQAGFELDTDARSNTFGQLRNQKMGVRLNLFGQDLQWVKPLVQMSAGTISQRGNYLSPNAPGQGAGAIWNFISGKFVPSIRTGFDIGTGTTYNFSEGERQPTTAATVAKTYLPIPVRESIEASVSKEPLAKSVGALLLNMIGIMSSAEKPQSGKKIPDFEWWAGRKAIENKKNNPNPGTNKPRSIADIIRSSP
jgi:hypothetical protein